MKSKKATEKVKKANRWGINFTKEENEFLEHEKNRTGMPVSSIIRLFLDKGGFFDTVEDYVKEKRKK